MNAIDTNATGTPPRARAVPSLFTLPLLCALFTASSPLHAREPCDSLEPDDFPELPAYDKETYLVQGAVYEAYRKPGEKENRLLTDGIVGPVTVGLFQRFCTDLAPEPGVDVSAELIAAAKALAALQGEWSGWREIVSSKAFTEWTRDLPPGLYKDHLRIGEPVPDGPVRLFLLDAFPGPDTPEDPPPVERERGGVGLHVLTEDDLTALVGGDDTLDALGKIAGQRFATRRELRKALRRALASAGDGAPDLVELLLASAESGESFGLRDDFRTRLVGEIPPELIGQLAVLAEGRTSSREALIARIDALVDELATRYRRQIIDRVPPAPVGGESDGDVAASDASARFGGLRSRLRDDKLPEAILEQLSDPLTPRSSRAVDSVTSAWKERIAEEVEPRTFFALAADALEEPALLARLQPVPDDLVTQALTTLVDVRFPDGHLLRKALRLASPGAAVSPRLESRILAMARKNESPQTAADLGLMPMRWKGTSCGCARSMRRDRGYRGYPDELYGLYPYWRAPQNGSDSEGVAETIDFSALNRIGYYGLGIDAEGGIVDPLHWREEAYGTEANPLARGDFADFVYRAHQYRTRVDAVVYNDDWSGWTDGQCGTCTNADTRVADRLIGSIASLVAPELERLSDRIKPIISFGTSPRRTLGDGVMLDFDFSTLSADVAQWLFDNRLGVSFFESLRKALNGSSDDEGDARFAVNLMVPARCLVEATDTTDRNVEVASIASSVVGSPDTARSSDAILVTGAPDVRAGPDDRGRNSCAYFRLENLQYLLDHIDLLVVDLSEALPGGETDSLDERMERVRDGIESLANIERRVAMLGKLVPLVVAGPAESNTVALDESIEYSRWNFAGLGSWLLPSQDQLHEVARAAFIGGDDVGTLASIEASVCSVVCPLRWYVRTLLFAVGVIAVVHLLASLRWFELSKVYGRLWFRVAVVATVMLLLVTFWCDPFWNRHRELLVVFAVAAALLAWWLSARRKTIERSFP